MPYTILLVEDDSPTRAGLASLLSEVGYQVHAVATLPEGLKALADEDPDLVLADIRLEGYNGLQLVAAGAKQVPTIVMTGFRDAALESEARRLGAEYLPKPIVPAVLLDAVGRKLAAAKEPTSSQRHPKRRWARRPLMTKLPVRIERAPARIVDISYGGACLEVRQPPGGWLPSSSHLTVPDVDVSVQIAVVWKRRISEVTWLCGAKIFDEYTSVWRGLVDAVS